MRLRIRAPWPAGAVLSGLVPALLGVLAPPAGAAVDLERVGAFHQPVHVTGPASRPRVLYVLERSGRVWRVRPRGGRSLFLDARRFVQLRSPRKHLSDQTGAFALALAPDHGRGGRADHGRGVYMLYTRTDGRVHLDEFRGGRPRTVLSFPRRGRVDVGGDLAFGPDGLLYASFGYGTDELASQDPDLPYGKVLRLDPGAGAAEPELVGLGLRVPWRMTFHRGRLVVADVGEAAFEEIDLLPLRAERPVNLGWPYREGRRRRRPGAPAGLTGPALSIPHGPGMCAIVGGHVLRGRYLYGDVCSGRLRSVRLGRARARGDRSERAVVPYLVSFGRDGGGRVYAVSVVGTVFRVR